MWKQKQNPSTKLDTLFSIHRFYWVKRNANTKLSVVFCYVLLDDSFFHIYPADTSSFNEAEINVVTYYMAWLILVGLLWLYTAHYKLCSKWFL